MYSKRDMNSDGNSDTSGTSAASANGSLQALCTPVKLANPRSTSPTVMYTRAPTTAPMSPPHMIRMGQSTVHSPQGPPTPNAEGPLTPTVYSPTRDSPHALSEAEGARITRQIEDLKITNMTLTQINRTLEEQVKKQQQELKQLRVGIRHDENFEVENEVFYDTLSDEPDLGHVSPKPQVSLSEVSDLSKPNQLDKCLELSHSLLQEYTEAVHSVSAVSDEIKVKVKGL